VVRILDVYSGMGGLSLGFALALGAEIEGIDIDGGAVAAYNLNLSRLGCRARVGDALRWKPKGDYDVVVGGPPCEPFSRINVRNAGVSHPLYPTLPRFFEIVREVEPAAFLMENVPELLTRYGQLLSALLSKLDGYRVKTAVIDASRYGVPQRRRRLFVVGVRGDLGGEPRLPPPTHRSPVTVREAIGDLGEPGEVYRGAASKIWLSSDRRAKWDEPAPTLLATARYAPLHPEQPRRLSVREYLRLQTFPDWWRLPRLSVAEKYRLAGEAVPPALAYRLAVSLARCLGLKAMPPREEEWSLPYFRRLFRDYCGPLLVSQ
jgi:DNA (cytosine-5)-methyltransferase 1